MSHRPILVGLQPALREDASRPLGAIRPNCTGWRIAELLDMTPEEYEARFDRFNVSDDPDHKITRTSKLARARADRLSQLFVGKRVVILSKLAAQFFQGVPEEVDWFFWNTVHSPHGVWRCAVIPHLSGRNRVYNDPRNRELARSTLQEALYDQEERLESDSETA